MSTSCATCSFSISCLANWAHVYHAHAHGRMQCLLCGYRDGWLPFRRAVWELLGALIEELPGRCPLFARPEYVCPVCKWHRGVTPQEKPTQWALAHAAIQRVYEEGKPDTLFKRYGTRDLRVHVVCEEMGFDSHDALIIGDVGEVYGVNVEELVDAIARRSPACTLDHMWVAVYVCAGGALARFAPRLSGQLCAPRALAQNVENMLPFYQSIGWKRTP